MTVVGLVDVGTLPSSARTSGHRLSTQSTTRLRRAAIGVTGSQQPFANSTTAPPLTSERACPSLLLLLLLLSMATSISTTEQRHFVVGRRAGGVKGGVVFIRSVFDSTHAPVLCCRQSTNATTSQRANVSNASRRRHSCNSPKLTTPRLAKHAFLPTVQLKLASHQLLSTFKITYN